jgi:hypothetical protein
MIPTHTIPSLSGTFGIPSRLTINPKMPKEPSSPSRSYAQRERQCINERIDDEMNQGQRTIEQPAPPVNTDGEHRSPISAEMLTKQATRRMLTLKLQHRRYGPRTGRIIKQQEIRLE